MFSKHKQISPELQKYIKECQTKYINKISAPKVKYDKYIYDANKPE